jgi:hypothetical protein
MVMIKNDARRHPQHLWMPSKDLRHAPPEGRRGLTPRYVDSYDAHMGNKRICDRCGGVLIDQGRLIAVQPESPTLEPPIKAVLCSDCAWMLGHFLAGAPSLAPLLPESPSPVLNIEAGLPSIHATAGTS